MELFARLILDLDGFLDDGTSGRSAPKKKVKRAYIEIEQLIDIRRETKSKKRTKVNMPRAEKSTRTPSGHGTLPSL